MKRLRNFIIVVLVVIMTLTMAACAKSAFEFDEDAAIQHAKEVIDIVNTKDYEAIYNAFGDDVKKLLTVDSIKASFEPILDPLGTFVAFESAKAIGSVDKDGKEFINVYVKTIYKDVTHVYNVAFDRDLSLQGFFTMS